MSYIAYLDLLGTKSFCEEEKLYYENIKIFCDSVNTLSPIFESDGKIGIFSDCIYIECSHLDKILDFLTRLRRMLMGNNLFFNAALSNGTLGVESIESLSKTNMFGVRFTNKEIASIYCKQVAFRGVGIWVDPKIVEKVNSQTPYRTVLSIFYSKEENNGSTSFTPTQYYDIPLFPENSTSSISFSDDRKQEVLSIILKTLYTSHCKSPKFSSYYVSLIVNIIRCCDMNCISWNQSTKSIDNFPIEAEIIFKFLMECDKKLDTLIGLDSICLALLDSIYNSKALINYDKADITEFFINNFSCLNKKYKYSLDKVPKEPFTKENRRSFINYCNSDMARQFVDSIIC